MIDFCFPKYMTDQRRWMVRTTDTTRTKLPQSPLEAKPEAYDHPTNWRFAWNNPLVWGTFAESLKCWGDDMGAIAGFCYVLHPGNDFVVQTRLICLDFDNAIDDDGKVDPAVMALLVKLKTFVEISVSGRGLHAFILVVCKPFKNALQRPIGNCRVDILCSSQVAVTGQSFKPEWVDLRTVPTEFIEALGLKEKKAVESDIPDIWTDEYSPEGPTDYLVEHMEDWATCYRSSKGSQLGEGGDVELFRAACHLARKGVTGVEADRLLQYVPADPPFSEEERRHKIESAFVSVDSEGEYGIDSAALQFPAIEVEKDTDQENFGFVPIRLTDLEKMDLEVAFAVDRLLVEGEGLFIGGREKTFKTGIAADLAISLATGVSFLDTFDIVSKPKTIAFFTAEIGQRAAKSLFGRIRKAKGIKEGVLDSIDVIDSLPSFHLNPHTAKPSDPKAIAGLKRYFEWRAPDVAIFDPLYLAMTGASVGDMYAIGGVLNHMAKICQHYGVWPIFCHHARKDQTKDFQPMELGDMYGSGVSAFARQWLLLSHAEPFENGQASLYCKAGGSAAGDCGLWRVCIDEGRPDELIDRRWRVTVEDETGADSVENNEEVILQALGYFVVPQTLQSIATYAEIDKGAAEKTLIRLVKSGRADLLDNKYRIAEGAA